MCLLLLSVKGRLSSSWKLPCTNLSELHHIDIFEQVAQHMLSVRQGGNSTLRLIRMVVWIGVA